MSCKTDWIDSFLHNQNYLLGVGNLINNMCHYGKIIAQKLCTISWHSNTIQHQYIWKLYNYYCNVLFHVFFLAHTSFILASWSESVNYCNYQLQFDPIFHHFLVKEFNNCCKKNDLESVLDVVLKSRIIRGSTSSNTGFLIMWKWWVSSSISSPPFSVSYLLLKLSYQARCRKMFNILSSRK